MELGSKYNDNSSQLDYIYLIKQFFKTMHIKESLSFSKRSLTNSFHIQVT